MALTEQDFVKAIKDLVVGGVDIEIHASLEDYHVDAHGANPLLSTSTLTSGVIKELDRLEDKEEKLLVLSSVMEQLKNKYNDIKGEN